MSIQAVAFVLDSDVPEVAAKMLLVCLANAHNNETGLCCPSVNRLADESNMSRRSVQRWIKWLDENGFVEVIATATEAGRQQSNSYRIIGFHRGAKLTPLPRVGGAIGDTGEGDTADALGGATDGTPLKEPEENQKNEPEQASARVSLDIVWGMFPHRSMPNRAATVAAWSVLTDEETHRCFLAVRRYAQWHIEDSEDRKVEPETQLDYRPGMGKWISSGAWVSALTVSLRRDPAPANAEDLVALAPDHPDFQAVERMLGKKLYVPDSGKRTFRRAEIEQARTAA